MSAALPSPSECCSTCGPSECGTAVDFSLLITQILAGKLNVINVMDTQWAGGAKGDGVTDDTAAIQAAIDACLATYLADGLPVDYQQGSARMRPLYFPSPLNFYLISDTLSFALDKLGGLVIFGCKSLIRQSTAGKAIFSFEGSLQQDVWITGFKFDYATPQTNAASNCISFEGGPPGYQGEPQYRHFVIEDCDFQNCYSAIKKQDNGANYCTVWGCTFRNLRIWYHYGSGIDLYSVSTSGNPNNCIENVHGIGSRQTQPFFRFRVEQNLILRNIELNAGSNLKFLFINGALNLVMEACKLETSTYTASTDLLEFQESNNVSVNGFSLNAAIITNGTLNIFKVRNHGGLGPIANTYHLRDISIANNQLTAPGVLYIVEGDETGGLCPVTLDYPEFRTNIGIYPPTVASSATDFYRSIAITNKHRLRTHFIRDGLYGVAWSAGATFFLGQCIQPTVPNGHFYLCTVTGISGGSEPVWPVAGGTVVDGTVTWTDTVLPEDAIQLTVNSATTVVFSDALTANRIILLPFIDVTKNIVYNGFKFRLVRNDNGLNDLKIYIIGINAAPPPVYTFALLDTLAAGARAWVDIEYTPGIPGYWLITSKGTL